MLSSNIRFRLIFMDLSFRLLLISQISLQSAWKPAADPPWFLSLNEHQSSPLTFNWGKTKVKQSSGQLFTAVTASIKITPTKTPFCLRHRMMRWVVSRFCGILYVACFNHLHSLPIARAQDEMDHPCGFISVCRRQSFYVAAFVGGSGGSDQLKNWKTALTVLVNAKTGHGGFLYLSMRQKLKDRCP